MKLEPVGTYELRPGGMCDNDKQGFRMYNSGKERLRVTVACYAEQVPAWRWVVHRPEYGKGDQYLISDHFREGREKLVFHDWQLIHRIEQSKIMVDAE